MSASSPRSLKAVALRVRPKHSACLALARELGASLTQPALQLGDKWYSAINGASQQPLSDGFQRPNALIVLPVAGKTSANSSPGCIGGSPRFSAFMCISDPTLGPTRRSSRVGAFLDRSSGLIGRGLGRCANRTRRNRSQSRRGATPAPVRRSVVQSGRSDGPAAVGLVILPSGRCIRLARGPSSSDSSSLGDRSTNHDQRCGA